MSASGLGSGDFMNETESFCRSSNASSDSLFLPSMGNNTFWSISNTNQVGSLIVGILILIFFLIATCWNLFIIITFFVKHELLSEPANIFLLNLAITDLVICLTTMIFSFVTAFAQEFIFGSSDAVRCILCNISGFFLVFLIFVSLHLLMALSIDRFILLSRPLRYKQLMKRWKALLICAIIYIVCFILAILPHAGLVGEIEFNPRLASCLPRFTPNENFYYVLFLAVESLIPIFVLVFTNVWTYRLVSKFLKKNFRRKSTYRKKGREGQSTEDTEGQKHKRQQKQLVKVFSALLVSNIISYTPTVLSIIIISVVGLRLPQEVYIIGFVSFLTSPVFHPIIESFFVKELRYQVTRAKHGVRRVSTSIYRGTTSLFSPKMLDEANKGMDNTDEQNATRSIQFLDGRKKNTNNLYNSSCGTEMEVLPNSRSPTPQLEGGGEGSNKKLDTTIVTSSSSSPSSSTASPDADAEPKGFSKLKSRRSVTFSTGSDIATSTSLMVSSPLSTSSLKEPPHQNESGPPSHLHLHQTAPLHNHHHHHHEEAIAEVSGTLERDGRRHGTAVAPCDNIVNYHSGNGLVNEAGSVSDTAPPV